MRAADQITESSGGRKAAAEGGLRPVRGQVASAHPLATQAGQRILERGGNAFDAAVAVASALNVVEPMMSGIGGYGTILVYDSNEKRIRYLNTSGKFPLKCNSDLMRAPTPGHMENRKGPKAISTPGNLNGWKELHQTYGRMPWPALFESAMAYAGRGTPVTPHCAKWIGTFFDDFSEYSRSFYGSAGQPLKEGDLLVQKDLARTFGLIAEKGPEPFYHGEIAHRIARKMEAIGSFLALEDLQRNVAEWWEPISLPYRGYDVYTAGMPSNAYPSLLALGILQQFDLAALAHHSTAYLHLLAEAEKESCKARLTHPGELEAKDFILARILSEDHFHALAAALDPARASDFILPREPAHENTTHFVIVDEWGNIVSATQTIGDMFGSRIMVEDTGIWLNNSMAYSSFEPKGNPMDVVPGRYKVSGDSPVIILKDGIPWATLGTPGGHTITQNVPQIILNLIDHGMDMQQAIDAPKIAFIEDARTLRVEPGIPQAVKDSLRAMGHSIVDGLIGNAMGIRMIHTAGGTSYVVGVDTRWDGHRPIANASM
jgi:gamma-glutamyltranspeptidase / glutathione hydrolase